MLQLVCGRAGSGKSEYCIRSIERLAREGRQSILLVPEQSSFAFERTMTLRLGDRLASFARIKSFRSLCEDIFTECGGGARKRAGDAVRCSLVRRAITDLGDDITCFRRHRRDISFFTLTASVIDELKNAGVTPEMLDAIALDADSELSSAKLREIARIYGVYESLLRAKYSDSAGELTAAAARVPQSRQFAGQTLFFDGYTGFTEPQYAMLSALMQKADDFVCTLTCDDILSDEHDAFTTVRRTGRRLTALAHKAQVAVGEPVALDSAPRFRQPGLRALEQFLAQNRTEAVTADGVFEIVGDDRYDEMARVSDEIAALVREENYRYSDIVVVVRELDGYRAAMERTFAAFGIPYFSDANRNLLYTPVTVFLLAALEIAVNVTTERVLQLLKTGLTELNFDTIAALENYLYIWNLDRGAWFIPFTEHPAGLGGSWDDEARRELEALEQCRAQIIAWLSPLLAASKEQDAQALVAAVYEVLRRCGGLKILENAPEQDAREASLAFEMMDALHNLLEGDSISAVEVRELAALLASATPLGDIPPTLEQVSVGTADRMRTENPRAVFVVGLNEGVFPKTAFDTPLLTGSERDLLARHGAPLTRSFDNSAVMEELYLYRALTCASERVYLCHAHRDAKGTALLRSAKPAAFLGMAGPCAPVTEGDAAQFIVNRRTAAIRYADAMSAGQTVLLRSIEVSDCGEVADRVLFAARPPSYALSRRELAENLLGANTSLSATRIETYSKCRFRYFLEYMLRIRPIKKAEINPLEAGNFVHGVLELALQRFGGELGSASQQQLNEAVAVSAERYVESQLGASAVAQPRIRYLLERLKEQSLRLLMIMQEEQLQSAFRPADYELEIARDGDVDPLILETPDGHRISVTGKVDRVDVYQKDGIRYLRVVDYKTGTKSFKLRDVYYGLSVQMLLYLFTIDQNGLQRYGKTLPAGVMYMPADPAPVSDRAQDLELEAKKAYRMDGIILDDPKIVAAMERDVKGVFIPVERDSHGKLKTSRLASLEKLGRIKSHIEGLVVDMARTLYDGDIDAVPVVDGSTSACDYCDYAAVCRHDRSRAERVLDKLKESELFETEVAAHADEVDA